MAVSGWLDDSRNPTLWTITIYPLLIILLHISCHLKMNGMIHGLPLAREDSTDRSKDEYPITEDASSADYDMIAQSSTDNVKENGTSSNEIDPAIKGSENRVECAKHEPSGHGNVRTAIEGTSRHNLSEIIKGALMFCLQILLAHRLGVLATGSVRATHHLIDKVMALLALTVATVVLLMSLGTLADARALALRGHRTNDGRRPTSNPSDPFQRFFVFSFLSLLLPWLRVLSSFRK